MSKYLYAINAERSKVFATVAQYWEEGACDRFHAGLYRRMQKITGECEDSEGEWSIPSGQLQNVRNQLESDPEFTTDIEFSQACGC